MRPTQIIIIVYIAFIVACAIGYVANIVKLVHLDFKAPYKAEVIRLIGIIPPVGVIVGYIHIKD